MAKERGALSIMSCWRCDLLHRMQVRPQPGSVYSRSAESGNVFGAPLTGDGPPATRFADSACWRPISLNTLPVIIVGDDHKGRPLRLLIYLMTGVRQQYQKNRVTRCRDKELGGRAGVLPSLASHSVARIQFNVSSSSLAAQRDCRVYHLPDEFPPQKKLVEGKKKKQNHKKPAKYPRD